MPRSSVIVKLPHKKKTSSFVEFGGTFTGHMLSDLQSYGKYAFWTLAVPGTSLKTGWTSKRPTIEELDAWKCFIATMQDETSNCVVASENIAKREATELFQQYQDRYVKD